MVLAVTGAIAWSRVKGAGCIQRRHEIFPCQNCQEHVTATWVHIEPNDRSSQSSSRVTRSTPELEPCI